MTEAEFDRQFLAGTPAEVVALRESPFMSGTNVSTWAGPGFTYTAAAPIVTLPRRSGGAVAREAVQGA